MAKFRKLSADDLAKSKIPPSGERARTRDEYRGYLKGLKPLEGGELVLGDDDKKITIKNRLKRAAEELGYNLVFKRSDDTLVRFQIMPSEEVEA